MIVDSQVTHNAVNLFRARSWGPAIPVAPRFKAEKWNVDNRKDAATQIPVIPEMCQGTRANDSQMSAYLL